eukprot:c1781_g1_i1.p1 GENE.c1781_g1_i1~~c1781_g1_i1.p1  ORF type:complete len:254 (-),score=49.21 c1781_g1_i1:25-741(-)
MQTVSEVVLKKRKISEKHSQQQRLESEFAKKPKVNKNQIRENFKRAEQFVAEYRSRQLSAKKVQRLASTPLNQIEQHDTVTLVIRTKSVKGACAKVKSIVQSLRLGDVRTAVFVKLDARMQAKLRLVQSYVTVGQPSLNSVKELIYKRGFAKIGSNHVALSDNRVIEEALGKYGIVCLEDLVHQIHTVGPHFDAVTRFLWPIKFDTERTGVRAITTHFSTEGGDSLETPIDAFVRRMN